MKIMDTSNIDELQTDLNRLGEWEVGKNEMKKVKQLVSQKLG